MDDPMIAIIAMVVAILTCWLCAVGIYHVYTGWERDRKKFKEPVPDEPKMRDSNISVPWDGERWNVVYIVKGNGRMLIRIADRRGKVQQTERTIEKGENARQVAAVCIADIEAIEKLESP
jgi:hypothetical protein